jgi:hypothetical protein
VPVFAPGDRLGNPHDDLSDNSVSELLRIRIGDDPWRLALVQREEVWDVERMARRLDSLLARYPVGASLLCRTDKAAPKVVDRDEDTRPCGKHRRGVLGVKSATIVSAVTR